MINNIINGMSWDKTIRFKDYTFVPIILEKTHVKTEVKIASKKVENIKISELKNESVGRVRITSENKSKILILPGVIFEGGRQTRAAVRPFIISSGTSKEIPVNCVEKNRWGYDENFRVKKDARDFKFTGKRVSFKTKTRFSGERPDQAATWDSIETIRTTADIDIDTVRTSSHLEIEKEIRKKSAADLKKIRNSIKGGFILDNQNGMAVFENDQLKSIEVFVDGKHWKVSQDQIMESYLFDLLLSEETGEIVDQDVLRNIVENSEIKMENYEAVVDENAYKLSFRDLQGWGVGDNDELLYLTIDKVDS